MRIKSDVLLTYGWVRSTYSALRNLNANGLTVDVSDTGSIGMCQLSRLKRKSHLYTSPFQDEIKFIDDLNRIIDESGAKVLIPSHDETEVIAKHIKRMQDKISIPIPSYEQLKMANDKFKSADLAKGLGISLPITYEYKDINELKDVLNNVSINNKFVIKLRRGNSSKGVFYADSKNDLFDYIESIIEDFSLESERFPIVQDYVSGDGWGVSCLYWKGERIASFTHKRLREKLKTGGTSTLRKQCDNPVLEEMAYKLLDSLKWHGLAMVEFKYNEKLNKGWFIEINPRMWGSINLAISSGVQFPYLLYLCSVKGPETAIKEFKNCEKERGMIARWYLGDLIIAAQNIKQFKLINAVKHILPGGTNCYDDIIVSDPLSFLGEVGHYGFEFLKHRSMNPISESVVG